MSPCPSAYGGEVMDTVLYPVVFESCPEGWLLVTVPDLDIQTQGEDMLDAINMARDLISLWVMNLQDEGKDVPAAGMAKIELPDNAIVSYVDANIAEYRKKYGLKVVKKNCTIPAWLCTRAEELNINFSKTLQEALLAKVNAC